MLRRTLIAALVSALIVSGTADARPQRMPAAVSEATDKLDSTSMWIIAASVVGLFLLILLLSESEEDLIPVSP
ncbi:hypothetical protein KK137_03060 [Croceibacterium sp. LX-88]|uniref:Uncharacterized protein n=1 Tax=Croceibacterium selenioxidans TaxID=2838833 RepID=A0ABS5W0S5_9SPHN|nr:hypothetical protein [Croceibacterium selenioxidans]MBT2133304.1 hypothetical protein [Croceibacterium selenioxidans]